MVAGSGGGGEGGLGGLGGGGVSTLKMIPRARRRPAVGLSGLIESGLEGEAGRAGSPESGLEGEPGRVGLPELGLEGGAGRAVGRIEPAKREDLRRCPRQVAPWFEAAWTRWDSRSRRGVSGDEGGEGSVGLGRFGYCGA